MLKLRPYVKGSDEETYVRIYNTCFGDYDDIRAMTLDEMHTMEEAPHFSVEGLVIAEFNGETAGMVHAYVDKKREDRKGFVQSLAVLPEHRGKGIAKQLVHKALESLKARGIEVAEAWAQSDRTRCTHLFESFGFKQARCTSMMKRSLGDALVADANTFVQFTQIRLRDDEDVALHNKLENEAFKEHFNFRPRTIEETKYMLQDIPWFKDQSGWFAFLNNQPIGYVVAGIDVELNQEKNLKYGWVLDICVLKPNRRTGVGTSSMLHSMRWLKSKGMEDALLYVDDLNPTGAFRLYEKLGFKVMRRNIIYQLELK